MTLIDVSVLVQPGTPEWPGDAPYTCGWTATRAQGAPVNLSCITMSPHVGTHADAPLHVEDGLAASDALPLDTFLGRTWVCTVPEGSTTVELEALPTLPRTGTLERVLLRTGCTVADGTFPAVWPVLSVRATRTLLARGLRLLGVDTPSVDDRTSQTLDVHHLLFASGAYNVENLDLRHVADGEYDLFALPIRLGSLDAAPLRAALRPVRASVQAGSSRDPR